MRPRNAGFTLTELIVAVAIVGILASIAIPSYTAYVKRTVRSSAQRVLAEIANRQERYFLDSRAYTTDFRNLGYQTSSTTAVTSLGIDKNGDVVTSGGANAVYDITLSATPTSTYRLSAAAKLSQTTDKANGVFCSPLTLDAAGTRGPGGC